MVVDTCRRCGESLASETGEVPAIECAGERVELCIRCYEEFKDWFFRPVVAPELESEPAGR